MAYRGPYAQSRAKKRGKTFKQGNKLVRYVYIGTRKVGIETVRHLKRGFYTGARRYVADKTYRKAYKKWK
jgi:hypothetical protein